MEAEEKLQQIKSDLQPYIRMMGTLADQVLVQDVSNYPIFVIHPDTIELGLPVVEKSAHNRWAIHVSTLEEFSTKQIIQEDKIQEFRRIYKDPKAHLCLFVLSDLGAQFIFLPRDGQPTT
ncbi:MAG: hypothetical protein R2787_16155 [Saprospiraceae bacterium]|nr:hypothetical protein [Saprospiraceae bacterium]MCB9313482.1 hypothetical protein [Lewinellaceae bacterium]HRW74409.1 hypothetical protein [Saprospiraceae bacterium]